MVNGEEVRLRGENFNNAPGLSCCGGQGISGIDSDNSDYARMYFLGANSIRLGLEYDWYRGSRNAFFSAIDAQVGYAQANGLWVILNLYMPPGGSPGGFQQYALWGNQTNLDLLNAFWGDVAAHYVDNPTIAGYDLLNEPAPASDAQWVDLSTRLYGTVRASDSHHLVVLEAPHSNDLSRFSLTDHVLYSVHHYQGGSNYPANRPAGTPLWVGEFGAMSSDAGAVAFVSGEIARFEADGVSWCHFVERDSQFGLYGSYSPGDFGAPWAEMISVVRDGFARAAQTVSSPGMRSSTTRKSYGLAIQQPDSATTWYEVDPALRIIISVPATSAAVIGANMDLWTARAGYNQDLGIFMSDCSLGNLLAWKESGGFGGTFSPNAAFVQTVIATAGTYTLTLCWKANKPAPPGTIFGAAGTAGTYFSPTTLTARVVPSANLVTAVTFAPYSLTAQQADVGSTWFEVDPRLRVTITAPASGSIVLGASMDLWTAGVGYNQDLAVFRGTDCRALANLVTWKESGGFGGTLSPNAAFAEGVVSVAPGQAYNFTLCWKANRVAPLHTINGGAGTADTYFSPTRLTAAFVPGSNFVSASQRASYHLDVQQADPAFTWYEIDSSLRVVVTGSAGQTVLLGANMDLWTAEGGLNQDLAIFAGADCTSLGNLLAWTESGGSGGVLSPNAAFVQAHYRFPANGVITFTLCWKANRLSSGRPVFGAAGTGDTYFSPTRLTAELSA